LLLAVALLEYLVKLNPEIRVLLPGLVVEDMKYKEENERKNEIETRDENKGIHRQ
jgi:hypothetical protein